MAGQGQDVDVDQVVGIVGAASGIVAAVLFQRLHHPALAQTRASALPAFATAPPAAVTAFASAQAAMWEDIGESAPHPDLAAAAARWVQHRTG